MFRARPKTATEWIVRLNAAPISAADKRALARWLADRPDRTRELENSSLLWKISGLLDGSAIARSYLEQDIGPEKAPSGWLRNRDFSHVFIPLALAAVLADLAVTTLRRIEKLPSGARLSNGRSHTQP